MKELLTAIARGLVEDPDAVSVWKSDVDQKEVLLPVKLTEGLLLCAGAYRVIACVPEGDLQRLI